MNKRDRIIELLKANSDLNSREVKEILKDKYSLEATPSYIRQIKRKLFGTDKTKEETLDDVKLNRKYSEAQGEVEINSYKVKTLDEALELADVDLEIWEVERWIHNSWPTTMKMKMPDGTDKAYSVTNHQVKIWLKRKTKLPVVIALENLVERIPTFQFKRTPKFTSPSGLALEVALIDAHIAKMAWKKETGRRNYDLKESVKDYLDANEKSLNFASPFKVEKIYFIVGNDLMHTESFTPKTFKAGHVLDVDSRLPKIFEATMEVVTKCAYMCRDVAETELIWVPGNHDAHASMYLCYALREHFRNDKYVTIDVSPPHRKARLWGNLLVGWTHEIVGRHHSWANELAQAFPEMWGQSKFREWHHGHKHKKSEVKTHPVMTHGGVLMRQLTALSPIDAWHYEYLFTDAVPGGESFLWSKDSGVIANFVAWTKEGN